jgi:hypothetical protein
MVFVKNKLERVWKEVVAPLEGGTKQYRENSERTSGFWAEIRNSEQKY